MRKVIPSILSSSVLTMALATGVLCQSTALSSADTLNQALAYAYTNNPDINASRAGLRGIDEDVAIAKSGYRPVINGAGTISKNYRDPSPDFTNKSISLNISQTLFDGLRTKNNTAGAISAVKAGREDLRNSVQTVFLNAIGSYIDVIQNTSIVGFRKKSLEFLNEQVRSEKTRFEVGESTRTDVAQAEGRRAAAIAQLSAAKANLIAANAAYRQHIGKQPNRLKSPRNIGKLLPKTVASAQAIAHKRHPAILARLHLVDQAAYSVKVAKGAFLPTLSLNGSVSHDYNSLSGNSESGTISAKLSVPIYQGGKNSAQVRKGKEALGQRRILVDAIKNNVRAQVTSAYAQYSAARDSVNANNTQLKAARLALQGAVEERKVGQRTTLDVLNTQQEVINAQVSLAQSQRNYIDAQYSILATIGALSTSKLALNVTKHDPEEHFNEVKDKWFGLRTTNGE